jgi:hypothetical protein
MTDKPERFQKVGERRPVAPQTSARFRLPAYGLAAHPVGRKRSSVDVG